MAVVFTPKRKSVVMTQFASSRVYWLAFRVRALGLGPKNFLQVQFTQSKTAISRRWSPKVEQLHCYGRSFYPEKSVAMSQFHFSRVSWPAFRLRALDLGRKSVFQIQFSPKNRKLATVVTKSWATLLRWPWFLPRKVCWYVPVSFFPSLLASFQGASTRFGPKIRSSNSIYSKKS